MAMTSGGSVPNAGSYNAPTPHSAAVGHVPYRAPSSTEASFTGDTHNSTTQADNDNGGPAHSALDPASAPPPAGMGTPTALAQMTDAPRPTSGSPSGLASMD